MTYPGISRPNGSQAPRVLVTGVGGGVGQSIIKCLQHTPYHIVAMDPDPLAAGLHAVPTAYLGQPADDPIFLNHLLEVSEREGCALVFPGVEPELSVLADGARYLTDHGVVPVVSSPATIRICDDKLETAVFLRSNGFTAPDTVPLPDDVDQSWFPFVVKPRTGGARSRATYFVPDRETWLTVRPRIDSTNCVVQEYLDGDEYTCGTVNFDGICYGVIIMRRVLRDGDTYKAFVVRDSAMEAHIKAAAEVLKPFGACNFQFRLRRGEPCIFEINARCSGTTYARALAGFNEPKMIADWLLAGVTPRHEVREISILRYWNELVVDGNNLTNLRATGTTHHGQGSL